MCAILAYLERGQQVALTCRVSLNSFTVLQVENQAYDVFVGPLVLGIAKASLVPGAAMSPALVAWTDWPAGTALLQPSITQVPPS